MTSTRTRFRLPADSHTRRAVFAASVAAIGTLSVSVSNSVAAATTLADWTFETSQPTTAGPFAAETGVCNTTSFALGKHAGVATYSHPAGNSPTAGNSFSSNVWAVGDYYQFSTNTTGYNTLSFSFDVSGSSTGPKNFEVEYSTDNTTYTNFAAYSVTTAFVTQSEDLSGVNALNNLSSVYIRLVDSSTTSITNGTVATTGTSRIDNVTFAGTSTTAATTTDYWIGSDTTLGGAGSWTSTSTDWSASPTTISAIALDPTKLAYFGTTGGAITADSTAAANNGIEFNVSGYAISGGNISLGGATQGINTITVDSGVTATIGSVLTGSAGLTVANGGGTASTLILTGANTFTGGTSIGAKATVQLGDGTTAGSLSGSVVDAGTLALNPGATMTFGNTISGAGTVNVQSGVVSLSNTNTYSGMTTVSGGTLEFDDTTLGSGNIVLGGGTLQAIANVTGEIVGSTSTSAAPNRSVSLTASTASIVNTNGPDSTAHTVIFGKTLSGSGTLTVNGGGTLEFAGESSQSTGAIEVSNGASLVFLNPSASATTTAYLDIGSATPTVATSIDGSLYFGETAASAALTTAPTPVAATALEFVSTETITGGGLIVLAPKAVIDVYNSTGTSSNIVTGTVSTNQINLTSDGSNGQILRATNFDTLNISSNIGGTSAGVMIGAVVTGTPTATTYDGKVITGGSLSYTGTTTVAGGTFVVNGALSGGAITVGAGETTAGVSYSPTLAGTGAISTAVTLTGSTTAVGGTITAGSGATATDKIGTLQVNSTLTAKTGSIYTVKIDGAHSTVTQGPSTGNTTGDAGVAGTVNDYLVFSGLTGSTGLTINPVAISSGLVAGSMYSFLIAEDVGGAANSTDGSTFDGLTLNVSPGSSGVSLSSNNGVGSYLTDYSSGGNEFLVLDEDAAPEPTSAILLGLAAIPMLIERRRRRRDASTEVDGVMA